MGTQAARKLPRGHWPAKLPDPKGAGDLARIALDALIFMPPLWINSVFGSPRSWAPPHAPESEFNILDPIRPDRALRFLFQTSLPGWATRPFRFVPSGLNPFRRPTRILNHPDHAGNPCSHPDEAWFYINGICTNEDVARINAGLIAEMFHRPMTIVQNSTNSLMVDLGECAIGKGWRVMTEPATVAFPVILDALNDARKNRVVVICHSQGTIVMANVLRALVNDRARVDMFEVVRDIHATEALHAPGSLHEPELLRKLEVYAFANCADVMTYVPGLKSSKGLNTVPWIESFGNEHDVVARLGMLAPRKEDHGIEIDGPAFVDRNSWGHLLNEHYLRPMRDHLVDPNTVPDPFPPVSSSKPRQAASSRLYEYFEAGRPSAY